MVSGVRTASSVAILFMGALAVAGCAEVQPHAEAVKVQLDKADAYLRNLLGTSGPARPSETSAAPEDDYRRGLGYLTGDSVPRDNEKAAHYLGLAAQHGHAEAQYLIGAAYSLDAKTREDQADAVHWFQQAAAQGHVQAQFRLAEAYLNGTGVPRDPRLAATWFRKAAEQGDRESQFILGNLYVAGVGVGRDYDRALNWYSQAADGGHPDAGRYRDAMAKTLARSDKMAEGSKVSPAAP